jgi:hypothetical protein
MLLAGGLPLSLSTDSFLASFLGASTFGAMAGGVILTLAAYFSLSAASLFS